MHRTNEMERKRVFTEICAEALKVEIDDLDETRSWVALGGDSMATIRLIARCEERGMRAKTADVIRCASITELFETIQYLQPSESIDREEVKPEDADAAPFSLWPEYHNATTTEEKQKLLNEVARHCNSTPNDIEDVYPSTPLQEGLMAITSRSPAAYVDRRAFTLPPTVDIARFRAALEALTARTHILRTRIIIDPLSGRSLQVVTRNEVVWREAMTLNDYLEDDRQEGIALGQPLSRCGLIQDKGSDGVEETVFVWTVHHSIYDGWSALQLYRQLAAIYNSEQLSPVVPYTRFVRYLQQQDPDSATQYWRDQLQGEDIMVDWPTLPTATYQPRPRTQFQANILLPDVSGSGLVMMSAVLRGAWALVMAQYSGYSDVIFGVTLSGRNAPVPQVADITAPLITTVPVRIRVDQKLTVAEFLDRIQTQATEMIEYEHTGLQQIMTFLPEYASALDFRNLLIIQPAVERDAYRAFPGISPINIPVEDFDSYGLNVECTLGREQIDIQLNYDEGVITTAALTNVMEQFSTLVRKMCRPDAQATSINEILTLPAQDAEQIKKWNADVPSPVHRCIHDLVQDQVRSQPAAIAVDAWDGRFTYAELASQSMRLAQHLTISHGVGPEQTIGLCMDKSRWAVVAMLAILYAGGAVLPLSGSHPLPRLQGIVEDANTRVILVDASQAARLVGMGRPLVIVDSTIVENLSPAQNEMRSGVTPSNMAWVVYTSGSTGMPKGVVLEHQSLCTSLTAHAKAIGITEHTRTLQFAAYTFDVSIMDTFSTLQAGGCVCVPSEEERLNRLAEAAARLEVNYAELTSTVTEMLSPSQVPSLTTLLLSGEPLKPAVLSIWAKHARVFNSYGPTECSITASNSRQLFHPDEARNIGAPMESLFWVVQSDNHQALCPIGTPGELLIEGPLLARGYLNDETTTNDSFITEPRFPEQIGLERTGRRMYRTGDLVQQNRDGSLLYVGRCGGQQVKIRGQRVDVSEVEHQITQRLPGVKTVAVELVGQGSQLSLMAVIEFAGGTSVTAAPVFEALREQLLHALPQYMVPTLYMPTDQMPINASGKLDRRGLRAQLQALTIAELQEYALNAGPKSAPSTAIEHKLQVLWAETLKVDPACIGREDSFVLLGGDSIAAMRMASLPAAQELHLSVADIFQHARLSDLARELEGRNLNENMQEADPAPFALWDTKQNQRAQRVAILAAQCGVTAGEVEDIIPCTAMQEGLMALTTHQPTAYVGRQVYRLAASIDTQRFQEAWKTLVYHTPILRTRLAVDEASDPQTGGLVQIVVGDGLTWKYSTDLDEYLACDEAEGMALGQPLVRLALVQQKEERFFIFTGHHSVYDGWSASLMFQRLAEIYLHNRIHSSPVPYSRFIRHLLKQDPVSTAGYWSTQLEGEAVVDWPPLPRADYQPRPMHRATHTITLPDNAKISTRGLSKLPHTLRAAWALVMATYAGGQGNRVVFGATVSGRNAPIRGITEMVGPTITTVPVAVQLDTQQTVSQFLEAVQKQAADMIPFEQTGLQIIRKLVPASCHATLELRNLFLVQPLPDGEETDLPGLASLPVTLEGFDTYGLTVQCSLGPDAVTVEMRYDENVIASARVKRIMNCFDHVVNQLYSKRNGAVPLGDLSLLSADDSTTIARWNQTSPERIERCIHHLIEEQITARPDSQAICAWDGDLTYAELNTQATQLSWYLRGLKVDAERMVGICMDKSKFAGVAMLAVLQAGGVVVPLGVNHPPSRNEGIVEDTAIDIILVDEQQRDRLSTMPNVQLVVIEQSLLDTLTIQPIERELPVNVTPNNAAWVIYTSGSTGKPKGVVLQHRALCSSIRAHGARFKMGPHTRMLQFAAHTFDACIQDYFTTLAFGGVVCVPSEHERMSDLSTAVRKLGVTFATLTSTVARLIDPNDVSAMQQLALVGEPVKADVVKRWLDHVTVLNAYGPSECSIHSTCSEPLTDPKQSAIIGTGMGSRVWVADVRDYNRLCPIGVPGELLIEGPILAREYLNDPQKTEKAFITNPAFLEELGISCNSNEGRMYRTGDLVRLDEHGSLTHLGRRDTQIKIRGQRVEVGEIEYQITQQLAGVRSAAVELLEDAGKVRLTVALDFALDSDLRRGPASELGVLLPSPALTTGLQRLRGSLFQVLPIYMVPTAFLPIMDMPLNASGKLDRRAVRALLEKVSFEEQRQYLAVSASESTVTPSTPTESQLRAVWADMLQLPVTQVNIHDNFFQLGGDSVVAMRMVATESARALKLTVADIFQSPRLTDLANLLSSRFLKEEQDEEEYMAEDDPEPFSLWYANEDLQRRHEQLQQIAQDCDVRVSSIQDVYPCTPLQEAMMAITSRQSAAYINRQVFELDDSIDVDRLQSAWRKLAQAVPTLRTRIAMSPGKASTLVQVVVDEEIEWQVSGSLEGYLERDQEQGMALGTPLIRFGLIHKDVSGQRFLVWTAHHSLYDGWSSRLIYQHLADIYHAGRVLDSPASFPRFIRFLAEQDNAEVRSASAKYWSEELEGEVMSNWPPLPHVDYQPRPGREIIKVVPLRQSGPSQVITPANVVRAAWAITMAQYAGHDDVVFAATVSGRNAPVWQVGNIVAPTITTVPVRTHIDWTDNITSFLDTIQKQAADMIPYEHTGLRTIKAIIPPQLGPALDLRNVLVVQTEGEGKTGAAPFPGVEPFSLGAAVDFDSHGLTVDCTVSATNLRVAFRFDETVLPTTHAENILSHFTHVVQQLCDPLLVKGRTLGDMDLVSPGDRTCIFERNDTVDISRWDACIHDLVGKQALAQPNAPAVCAWDGDLSYKELASYASRLAHQLIALGVGPEKKVGLCLDKSRWAVVAMLATLQAGGAIVPLGVSHPFSRVEVMVEDSAAVVILVDEQQHHRLADLPSNIPRVIVDSQSLEKLPPQSAPVTEVSPDNAAWINYTSGSTGAPKGMILEHGGLCTSMRTQSARMHISNKTRALQFSPFTFDVSISDISATLIYGGCVCLPSESDRMNNLAGSIQTMAVNFASLTPTVARLLSPAEVPTLKTLALTGEALKPDVVALWKIVPDVALYNTYGPSEGSVCTCNGPISSPEEAESIGTPMATRHWVTQPHNYHQLSPIGAPGELLIEGPLIARGYLNNPEKTAASFVPPPGFLTKPSGSRIYRTGDLVRQNTDGSFTYLGRRDTQVKIRGQRVEIGEIEHQIVNHLASVQTAVVHLLEAIGLVAVVELREAETVAEIEPAGTIAPSPALCSQFSDLRQALLRVLPDYMAPALFVPVPSIPTNVSGKLDRRAVHELLMSLPTDNLGRWTAEQENMPKAILQPATEMEKMLQELWARMLKIPADNVSPQDDFFRLGGDSVTAMRMVATATRTSRHLRLVVTDIFQHPRLSELAQVLEERVQKDLEQRDIQSTEPIDPEPFALFADGSDLDAQGREQRLAAVAEQCSVAVEQVQDVYPCTPLQEGLLANTSRQQAAYVSRQSYVLSNNIDLARFKAAWEALAKAAPILRTRIVIGAEGSCQVVVKGPIEWLHHSGALEDYIQQDKAREMGLGQPLARYAIVQELSGEQFFVWTAHHSMYDGWTVRLLCQELINLYNREDHVPRPVPYTRFIRYLYEINRAGSLEFWKQQLEGDDVEADWPRLPHVGYEPRPRSTLSVNIADPGNDESSGIVIANILRAAWGLVMAQFSGHNDIVYAANVSGRTAPVPGVTDIIGPTIATVPVRMHFNPRALMTVESFLHGVQTQSQQMIDHEQTGLIAMRNHPNLQLRNLLVIQPADEGDTVLDFPGIEAVPSAVEDFDSYGVNIECVLGMTIRVQARFDDHIVAATYMKRVLDQFAYIVEQLCDPRLRALPLQQLNLLSPNDQQQISSWNAAAPESVEQCVHEMVEEQAMAHPTKLAVWAWDGKFTYQELAHLAQLLADQLVSLGIGPERMVGVCMDKSKWAAVAFLAILKAGGVVVPLGVSHPIRRIETILNDTMSDLVLVDAKHCQRLSVEGLLRQRLLVVDDKLQQHGSSRPRAGQQAKPITPDHAAWVIYTSGTTGLPKGAVLDHRALSSSIRAHGTRYKFGPQTRKLQYSAHLFDGTIEDYFTTLSWGGLCCVPSEDDRLDMRRLTAFMRETEVNALATTYTVAGLLTPEEVPSLQTLVLGGEPATVEVTDTWRSKVDLFNCYGPSECTVFSSAAGPRVAVAELHNIGHPIGTRLWVVNPDNPGSLCPVGAPGELLIEGPQLARGYLNDEAKTRTAFLTDLEFMRQFKIPPSTRVYRSGDIVRQKDDGSFVYVARRNTMQVKIRGQRVEVGEIEHQVGLHLAETRAVAVELLKQGVHGLPVLVAVVDFADNSQYRLADGDQKPTPKEELLPPTPAAQQAFTKLQVALSQVLPSHMIPSIYLPVTQLPRNISGKLDRRALRELLDQLSYEAIHQYMDIDGGEKAAPATAMERTLQSLWAQTLGMDIDRIGAHDNFFQLGGDSVAAMRLAAIVQQQEQLQLTVGDILSHPCLSDLANLLADGAPTEGTTETDPEPFSLWCTVPDEDLPTIAVKLGVAVEQIEDIYPATPLQEGFIAVTARQSAAYISRQVYKLSATLLDLDRFKASWETLVNTTPILRTRLSIGRDGHAVQVVVRDSIGWRYGTDLSSYVAQDREEGMRLDEPLMRYAIITEPTSGSCYFVWTAHHSIYDAWTIRAISKSLAEIYTSTSPHSIPQPTASFSRFIRYLTNTDTDAIKDFWHEQLAGDVVADWPPLPQNDYQSLPRGRIQKTIKIPERSSGILESTTLRGAWSIVMSQYAGSSDVVFAATVSGRNAPVPQINDIAGPTLTTVPVRVSVDSSLSVNQFLQSIQQQSTDMIPYEQTGLQRIKASLPEANQSALNLRNLLVIQLAAEAESNTLALPGWEAQPAPFEDFGSFGLQIECTPIPGSHAIDVNIQYDEKVISTTAVTRVAEHFVHVAEQLFNPGLINSALTEIQLQLSSEHKDVMLRQNTHVPPYLNRCIQEMVYERAALQPNAPAICAWDGNWTYAEVTDLAASFASYLSTELQIGPTQMVGVCMDKSKWAVVAMLAILCAGGTVVPLGVNHPLSRIQVMAQDTGLGVILVDNKQRERLFDLNHRLITVDAQHIQGLPVLGKQERTSMTQKTGVTPDDIAWIIYTSGSTGIPKGVMLEHRALATSMEAHGSTFGFGTHTRILQFAAHTFDATIQDMFTTLYKGGCVCIPSEYDRVNRLTESMASMSVNCATLTSTVASLLAPEELPSMQTIILVGEPVTPAAVALWLPHATVLNAYGPSECSIHSSCSDPITDPALAPNIGRPLATNFWVVDPNNYHSLRPIGAPGELLIEGPIQARGYLNDIDKTNAAFVIDPDFMKQLGLSGSQRRLYRTGDLVRQNDNGTLTHMGRRDLQVKIRGQRVEVGEVEYQIQRKLPSARTVAVEPLQHGDKDKHITLIAIMDLSDRAVTDELNAAKAPEPLPVTASLQATFHDLRNSLLQVLPAYMVPAAYLPVDRMPMNASNKLDRRAIRELITHHSLEDLQQYLGGGTDDNVKTAPRTVMEQQVHALWVEVLGLSEDAVGVYDNFLQLGGDSLTAMRIVAAAGQTGEVRVSVEDIFMHPTVADLALVLSERGSSDRAVEQEQEDPAPYQLWTEQNNFPADQIEENLEAIAAQCAVDRALIEDVYPCTPLQAGLMAITARQPAAYVSRQVYTMSSSIVDRATFQKAWQQLAAGTDILRTRIVMAPDSSSQALQVVVRDTIHWELGTNLDEYLRRDSERGMALGEPLVRYGIVEEPSGKSYFIWTAHHALYDGWTLGALSKRLGDIYQNRALSTQSVPYSRFIRYLQHGRSSLESSASYWREQLQGDAMANWPRRPALDYQPMPRHNLQRTISLGSSQTLVTTSTILRAAWALVIAQYAGHNDVVFAATVSGRSAPVAGIADIPAPTITTVPVRIRVDGNRSVADYLQAVQRQAIDMIYYEHTGLQTIKALVPDLASTLDAGSLMVIQPTDQSAMESGLDFPGLDMVPMPIAPFNSHGVTLECKLGAQDVTLDIHYDSNIIAPEQLSLVIDYFASLVLRLGNPAATSSPVADLLAVSEKDERQIRAWNSTVPPRLDKCIHEMVQEQVARTPGEIAIQAWDGQLTYREFHDLAASLAHHLAALGVGPETLVGVCMAKSKWGAVAMLAIMQAGGAIMPLGVSQPVARIQNILETSQAAFILVDEEQMDRLNQLSTPGQTPKLIFVEDLLMEIPSYTQPPATDVTPDNASWAIFTSGSTGTPKGVIIEHGTMSTSLDEQGRWLGLSQETRFLQFASYTFDNVITDTFATTSFGGCVCIPSESGRMDRLEEVMVEMKVNTAMLTSTVAQQLSPTQLPLMQKLILTGEPVRPDVVRTWLDHAEIYNAYGPTEGSMSTCTRPYTNAFEASNIGHPLATRLWVVQPDNPHLLSAIGAPGELYIEGPFLARGYLNDPVKTDALFLMDPPFTQRLGLTGRRVYRTGDLVQQNEDGTLIHLGRHDSQVKIRGQRVEISEIEHQITQHLPEASTVAVFILDDNPITLVAAVEFNMKSPHRLGPHSAFKGLLAPTVAMRVDFTRLYGALSQVLPIYMVPTVFIPMHEMSRNLSGKLDRRLVQTLLKEIPTTELRRYRLGEGPKIAPSTAMERQLQSIWSKALDLPEDQVGAHDNFFHIGGDSLVAMRIIAIARAQKLKLTVADLFKYPCLSEVAQVVEDRVAASSITLAVDEEPIAPSPFSLIAAENIEIYLQRIASRMPGCRAQDIVDILPTTDFQALTVAEALTTPGTANFAHFFLDGDGSCDVEALRKSCLQLIEAMPELRTAYVFDQGRLLQVVLRVYEPEIKILQTNDATMEEVTSDLISKQMFQAPHLGQPFTVITIIEESASSRHRVVLRLTHAEYDAVSMQSIWRQLRALYEGTTLKPRPTFASFLYSQRQKITTQTYNYWRTLLDESTMTPLSTPTPMPTSTIGHYPSKVAQLRPCRVHINRSSVEGITSAVFIKTAWAIALSRLSNRQDIIFADTVSSRGTVDESLMEATGCCVTLLPVRVKLTPETSMQDVLLELRTQQVQSLERAQLGFREILHECTNWPTSTRFTSAINCISQGGNGAFTMRGTNYWLSNFQANNATWTVDLGVTAVMHDNGDVDLRMAYLPTRISEDAAYKYLNTLQDTLQAILDSPGLLVSNFLSRALGGSLGDRKGASDPKIEVIEPEQEPQPLESTDKMTYLDLKKTPEWEEVLRGRRGIVSPGRTSLSFSQRGGDLLDALYLSSLQKDADGGRYISPMALLEGSRCEEAEKSASVTSSERRYASLGMIWSRIRLRYKKMVSASRRKRTKVSLQA
uniref:Putative Echinocandin B nonribosomal peptide synthase n=1 Tax=Aspergillus spinulosporus TaxID=1810908 RepID=U3TD66_9EURO|nr:putative Echinocandin B nonribosomal peptide synthase [Aspergillus spinulosporus]